MNKLRLQLQNRTLNLLAGLLVLTGLVLATGPLSAAENKSASNPADKGTGRLVIRRAANLGPTVVGLKIDGVEKAKITYNRDYEAPIAAGTHVLTVYPLPSLEGARPTEKRINVEAGKTYTFTAARDDVEVVLK